MNCSFLTDAIAHALGLTDPAAEFPVEDDFWMEEETEEQARERMSPEEQAADAAYEAALKPICGLCIAALLPHERVVCDWCHAMQRKEFNS